MANQDDARERKRRINRALECGDLVIASGMQHYGDAVILGALVGAFEALSSTNRSQILDKFLADGEAMIRASRLDQSISKRIRNLKV